MKLSVTVNLNLEGTRHDVGPSDLPRVLDAVRSTVLGLQCQAPEGKSWWCASGTLSSGDSFTYRPDRPDILDQGPLQVFPEREIREVRVPTFLVLLHGQRPARVQDSFMAHEIVILSQDSSTFRYYKSVTRPVTPEEFAVAELGAHMAQYVEHLNASESYGYLLPSLARLQEALPFPSRP